MNTIPMSDTLLSIAGIELLIPWYANALVFSGMIGLLVGVEREFRGKPASLRTFAAISVGSCLFTVLSVEAAGASQSGPYDLTRVAAQNFSGIGFIGGGVIFKTSDRIEGITTAALIWLTAGMGMACGFNRPMIALWAIGLGSIMHCMIYIIYRLLYFSKDRERRIAMEESSNA